MKSLPVSTAEYIKAHSIINNWRDSSSPTLPEDFDGWACTDDEYVAFPDRFPLVALAIEKNYPIPNHLWMEEAYQGHGGAYGFLTIAHFAAYKGYQFPDDFKYWTSGGWTSHPVVSAYLESRKPLPPGFNEWTALGGMGHAVANMYMRQYKKPLPANFNDWLFKDVSEKTVAQVAIEVSCEAKDDRIGRLPDDRSLWLTRAIAETSLLHLRVKLGGSIPNIFSVKDWHIQGKKGRTVIDLARRYGHDHLVSIYESAVLAENVERQDIKSRIRKVGI